MSHLDDNLALVHQFLGWGDPAAGLWFVGLEEGQDFDEEHLTSLRILRATAAGDGSSGHGMFWNRPRPVAETQWEPSSTDWGVGRLCAALEVENSEAQVKQYVCAQGWARTTFNTNLYALAHQRGRGRLPEIYIEQFGVQQSTEARVQKLIGTRHGALKALRESRPKPPILVCLGLGNRSEFEAVFSLRGGKERRSGKHRFLVYEDQRALVVHHASRGPFHRCIPDIAAVLRSPKFEVGF